MVLKQYIAAKAIIKNDQDQVLLLRQSLEDTVDGAGRYHAPGGIVEPGETLYQALKREIQEETKLEIEIIQTLSVEEWQANIRGDDCYFVGVFFECRLAGGEFNPINEETSGFAWVDKNDLEKLEILQPTKTVIESILH